MQSLANRHEDRARRKAMNRAERGFVPGISVGAVAIAYQQFATLRARLDERGLELLEPNIAKIDEEILAGTRSLAEAPDGSGETMAGIGVVNPLVVPAAVLARDEAGKGASVGNDPAWNEAPVTVDGLPEAKPLDPGSNINGQALVDQAGASGGWGTETPTTAKPEDANAGNGGGSGGEQS
jgi:hypothetical protein